MNPGSYLTLGMVRSELVVRNRVVEKANSTSCSVNIYV